MPGPWEDFAPPEAKTGPWSDYAPEKPFLEKLGSFARKVYQNPPPTIAGARDIIKAAPAAAQELTFGADPEAARAAAGTMAQAAGMGLGFRGLGGEGVFGRAIGAEAGAAPLIPPRAVVPAAAADPAVAAAGRLGIEVPRYLAAESTAVPQLAAAIKNVPFAGQPIVRSAQRLTEQLGQAKSGIAGAAGTPELAGERAKTGLTGFIKTESQKPISEAYKAVDALIDPTVRVPLDNTRDMIGQIMAERTQARIPGQSKAVQTVFDAVQDPRGMDYAGTKGLRSFLGEKTPLELASQGLAPTEIKRIYGALTKDLGAVVREAGGPQAFSAWQEANALTRLTKIQQQALSKITGAAGDAAPEAVFNRLATYAQSKAGADLNRLRLAKRAMGPEAWGEVGSALIDRLGMAPDGTFSPGRFVTAFGKMAPDARNELFSGQQHAALADLFTISKHVQDRIQRFENVSGTARGVFGNILAGGALFAEPISTLTGMVGTGLLAQALSRPAVVRAATQVARASLAGNPVATRRALAALQAVATREGLISGANQQNIPGRQAGGPVDEGRPYRVGEQGPETFVPDYGAAAAARTRRRYPTRTPDPLSMAASMGGAAGFGRMMQGQAGGILTLPERATRAAGELQRTGDYNPAPAVETSLLSMGMPMLAGGTMPGLAAAGMFHPKLYGFAQRNAIQQEMRANEPHGPDRGMAEGGHPLGGEPIMVGERGPEVFVPDQPGTIVPNDAFEAAAARVRRRYPTRTPDPASMAASMGGAANWQQFLPSEQRALESAGSLQRGGDYNPRDVLLGAIGAVGAPAVGPAQAGSVLGAGAVRRMPAPAIRSADTPLFDYSRLREVPDVPQVNLERYQPPRGVAERTQALADPANVARVNEVVKRGAQQGGIEWYNTDPLRQAFIAERGPAGEAAYQQYLDLVASTSPRSNVGTNIRNAGYYYGLAQRGEPLPQPIAKGGALSIAQPLPAPYGHIAQGLHAQNAKNVLEAGGWPVLQNPKPASFAQNLAGNQMPVTVDTHNARLWGMTDTKGRPIDKPAKTEYDFMERLQQAEAAKLGMTPAQYQASAWIGGGEQTGLKSSADPFLKVLEDRIRLTAQKSGETPQQVLRRFIMGQNIPGGAGPLLGLAGMAGADALSRRD